MWKLLIILAAILYSLSPVDFLPDYIVGWGWLDDVLVLVILWQVFVRLKDRFGAIRGNRPSSRTKSGRSGKDGEPQGPTPKSPHDVLGVPKNASQQAIRQAYLQLAARYHPDKVSHLGEEFRELAEKRFKEIQEAYRELSSQ